MKRKTILLALSLISLPFIQGICQSSALEFDGTACVDINEISELTGTAARSVDAWIKIPSVHDYSEGVIIEWGENSSGKKWTIRLDSDRLRLEHGGGNIVGTTTMNDDTWHHIAVTLPENADLTDAKLYVDGFEESYTNKTGGAVETGTGAISIGRSLTDDIDVRYWIGAIDEVRLWTKELSVFELIDILGDEVCPENTPELAAYYRFNEGTGSTVRDETGQHPGVLGSGKFESGAPVWIDGVSIKASNCSPVVEGMALEFEKNSCVDIPEITDLTGTAARTVEAWIMVPSTNEDWWQPVIIEWGQNNPGEKWDFRLDYYKLRVEHGQGYATATKLLNDDKWHHVAISVEAESNITDVKFYIDGYLDPISASAENNIMINTASGGIAIGRAIADDQEVRNWVGKIDEVRLWKVARTADQILANKDSEVCPESNTDLVAYFKMNEGSGTSVKDETGKYNGVLASGKVDDGIPSWVEGVSLYEGGCESNDIISSDPVHDSRLVYPNPASEMIRFAGDERVNKVEIFDLSGRLAMQIETPGTSPVDISMLNNGVYILRVRDYNNELISSVKLIKY